MGIERCLDETTITVNIENNSLLYYYYVAILEVTRRLPTLVRNLDGPSFCYDGRVRWESKFFERLPC